MTFNPYAYVEQSYESDGGYDYKAAQKAEEERIKAEKAGEDKKLRAERAAAKKRKEAEIARQAKEAEKERVARLLSQLPSSITMSYVKSRY